MKEKSKIQMRLIVLFSLLVAFSAINAQSKELPKTKRDWQSFDTYEFSGVSLNHKFTGDMYFKRNGVEVDLKKEKLRFKENGYFKINEALIKLEQDKLTVEVCTGFEKLNYKAKEVIKDKGEIYLKGNASLTFPNQSKLRTNEIIIKEN